MYLGIDIGSVSVKVVLLDPEKSIKESYYRRHRGQPLIELLKILKGISLSDLAGASITGTGGRIVSQITGIPLINEVMAANLGLVEFLPGINTLIEIGGQDSKLILFKGASLSDFAMNSLCAGGTGSFLDQQASRLGIQIEDFGKLVLKSKKPPRIAGRCSVFAKTDMIHLQQKATPVYDILAGLTLAMARNFKSTVGKGKKFKRPIAFVGGVAANSGMVAAFENVLELKKGELIVPRYHTVFGAIGAALSAMGSSGNLRIEALEEYLLSQKEKESELEKLEFTEFKKVYGNKERALADKDKKAKVYLGIDVGSISTNVVVMDENKNVLAKSYLMTAGRPLDAICKGLKEVEKEVKDKVEICGVCTTGSGRYLTGDFVGADFIKNEITAQARAAIEIDPEVDTIFEIGGQDSKYISVENGAVIDFEMNKACAAGTGSFLEEQAEKLSMNIKEEFGRLALSADFPARLGERCTVFMESDLVQNLQKGYSQKDLAAGLSYSIVYNYLNRVVQGKKVGNNIFFQGGVAFNQAVVAAFGKVTGKKITVPEHHEVTGAIGCCLLAQEYMEKSARPDYIGGGKSKFKGFDLTKRKYSIDSFECKDCPNHCEINKVTIKGENSLYYGSRCEKYDIEKSTEGAAPAGWQGSASGGKIKTKELPDLFAEREKLLEASSKKVKGGPRIGIPRAMFLYYEFFPFFATFFSELGCEVVTSNRTGKEIIRSGVERALAESCFPIKVAQGHIYNLLKKGIDYIFLPAIVNLPKPAFNSEETYTCPYVLALPFMARAAFQFEEYKTKLLSPLIYFRRGKPHLRKVLTKLGEELGRDRGTIRKAIKKAGKAQEEFYRALRRRGGEILKNLSPDTPAFVIVSRSYNGCDPGVNLGLPKVLRDLGVLALPIDFLPISQVDISEEWSGMYWKSGQQILAAAEIISKDSRLNAVYITNFGCGPDSFLLKFFKQKLGENPFLQIEIDEHSSEVGAVTRCEAFLDSLKSTKSRLLKPGRKLKHPPVLKSFLKDRVLYIPNMCDHAYIIASALIGNGMRGEVMPEGDSETLVWGRKFATGRECLPCHVTTGEIVKFVRRKDFDPEHSAFLMPTVGGGCRFSYYHKFQRMILDELGFLNVPIYSPNQGISFYRDLGAIGFKTLRQVFQGIIAVDILEKCLRETRPYEIEKGETDRIYQKFLRAVCSALEKNKDLETVLISAQEEFSKIKVERSVKKPLIGIIGEVFVRSNRFSNENIIRKIEDLGGEVWMPPFSEWFIYTNYVRHRETIEEKKYLDFILNFLIRSIQKYDVHKLEAPFKELLRNFHEPPMSKIEEWAAPFVDKAFRGEGVLGFGKAVDFVGKGASGIINVIPFTCMPGTVVASIIKRFREHYNDISFITLAYDGLGEGSNQIRLEAFMHQCNQKDNQNHQSQKYPEQMGI